MKRRYLLVRARPWRAARARAWHCPWGAAMSPAAEERAAAAAAAGRPIEGAFAIPSHEERLDALAWHQRRPVRHHLWRLRAAAGHRDAGRSGEDDRRHQFREALDLLAIGVSDREAQQDLGRIGFGRQRSPARGMADDFGATGWRGEPEPVPEQRFEGTRFGHRPAEAASRSPSAVEVGSTTSSAPGAGRPGTPKPSRDRARPARGGCWRNPQPHPA